MLVGLGQLARQRAEQERGEGEDDDPREEARDRGRRLGSRAVDQAVLLQASTAKNTVSERTIRASSFLPKLAHFQEPLRFA